MTYTERRFASTTTYTLDDRDIRVEGRRLFGGTFSATFSLSRLKATPDEMFVRDETRAALAGVPGFLITMIAVPFAIQVSRISDVLLYSIPGVGVVAMSIGFVFGGRVRIHIFKNSEESILFALSAFGKSQATFRDSSSAVSARVETLQGERKAAQPGAPSV